MPLPDHEIIQRIEERSLVISPMEMDEAVQPAGVDLRLGDVFQRPNLETTHFLRPHALNASDFIPVCHPLNEDGEFLMRPGDFVLATTMEYVEIPDDLQGRLDQRSTYARCGLFMHLVAGNIEPGFKGYITLEILNASMRTLALKPGERVVQLVLEPLTSPCMRDYASKGGRYHGQGQCTAPR